jgi:hypothetical protein
MRTTRMLVGALGLACLVLAGCQKGTSAKVMYGRVTCGGQNVSCGEVSFVPVEGSSQWICVAPIVDGQYRIDAGGGVPLGKFRVQVDARKKTGRKVNRFNGIETAMVEEEVPVGPKDYAGQHSPLVVEVSAASDGQFDIAIPPGQG